jgi:adenosylcobinamide kinase / adenosylcobinamide-phosphate guanylyltransferase
MGALLFVTGGARSGKSAFAERLAARAAGDGPVVYLATLEPLDQEMRDRIARHRASRPASWETIEAPRDPGGALAGVDGSSVVLLDCVSLWVSNRLFAAGKDDLWPSEVTALERAMD